MLSLRTWGGYAGFYMGAAYAVAIVIFLVVLDYPSMVDPVDKVGLLTRASGMIWASNLLLYVVFSPVLAVFVLAVHDLVRTAEGPARLGRALGLIWAGLLIASGLIANAAIGPITALFASDQAAAIALWSATNAVADGLGGGAGEVAGGLMTALFSLAGLKSGAFGRVLAWLGFAVGALGLVSALPGLGDVGALFGIAQIPWFVWVGIVLIRS